MSLLTFPRRSIAGRYRGKYQAAQIDCEFDKRFYRRDNVITKDFKLMANASFTGGGGYVQALAKNGVYNPVADGVLGETDKGLGLWDARTNSVRNPTGLGAVLGTPGTPPTNWSYTLTGGIAIDQLGTFIGLDGIPYNRVRFYGTPAQASIATVAFEAANVIAAAMGQTWTSSVEVKFSGGAVTNVGQISSRVQEYQGVTYLAQPAVGTPVNITSSFQKLPASGVLANASTTHVRGVMLISGSVGQAVDVTIDFRLPQLKQGADISDPPVLQINNAEATRTSNIPTITNIATLVQNPFTLFVECELNANANDNRIMVLDDSSGNDSRLVLRRGSDGRLDVIVISNNVTIGTLAVLPAGSFPGVALLRAAITWTGTQFRVSANGSAIASITAAVPVGVNVINLGYDLIGGVKLNGWYRTFAAFPFTMSDAQIQDITAVA